MTGPSSPLGAPDHCVGAVCVTCSDQAVPVRVLRLHPLGLADVVTEVGTVEEISVALVDACVGDVVLVHAKEALVVVRGET